MTSLTDSTRNGHDVAHLTPADVARLFNDGYREVEILPDGKIREAPGGDTGDEAFTRTLKTKRTWY